MEIASIPGSKRGLPRRVASAPRRPKKNAWESDAGLQLAKAEAVSGFKSKLGFEVQSRSRSTSTGQLGTHSNDQQPKILAAFLGHTVPAWSEVQYAPENLPKSVRFEQRRHLQCVQAVPSKAIRRCSSATSVPRERNARPHSATKTSIGVSRLPVLPKPPRTFDEMYCIAKKRANAKAVGQTRMKHETRPSIERSFSATNERRLRITRSQTEESLGTAAEVPLTGDEAVDRTTTVNDTKEFVMEADEEASQNEAQDTASDGFGSDLETMSYSLPSRISVRAKAEKRANQFIKTMRHIMGDGDFDHLDNAAKKAANKAKGRTSKTSLRSSARRGSAQVNLHGVLKRGNTVFDAVCSEVPDPDSNFSSAELARLRMAFVRFKSALAYEIHVDALPQTMRFLGHLRATSEACERLAKQVTMYSTLEFSEYLKFVEVFQSYEHHEFQEAFQKFDVSETGNLSRDELKALISSLGITPLKATLDEALEVVDFDGSGEVNFEEFVYLMGVYRVTEGFTLQEVRDLKAVFDRVGVRPGPGLPKEVKASKIAVALSHIFGPQTAHLAKSIEKRRSGGSHRDFNIDEEIGLPMVDNEAATLSPKEQPGLPFPEFLVLGRQMREAEIREYRVQFTQTDTDNSGFLDTDEIRELLSRMGFIPLRAMIEEITANIGGGVRLDFEQFVNVMHCFNQVDGFCADEAEKLREVFYDHADPETGTLFCVELTDIIRGMGYTSNLDNVRRFIQVVDFDNSNRLDLPEFFRFMRLHREDELRKGLIVFNEERGTMNGTMPFLPFSKLRDAMKLVGYEVTEHMLKVAVNSLMRTENETCKQEFDFDDFVSIMDECRVASARHRHQHGDFTNEEIKTYRKAFSVYDSDANGLIERHELSKLLEDLGLAMSVKDDQSEVLAKMDVARRNAKNAGVDHEMIGSFGDPNLTFHSFLFLIRVLHTSADNAEVDQDLKLMQATDFSPCEIQGFREVYLEWAGKVAELEEDADRVARKNTEFKRGSFGGAIGQYEQPEELARHRFLSLDGMRRVVKSIGLNMRQDDRRQLDKKLTCLALPNGMFGFWEFCLLMRWLLDTNFAYLNTTFDASQIHASMMSNLSQVAT